MNVRLVVCSNRPLRQVINLRQRETVLGRAADCTVRIPSQAVSRRHCRLRLEDGRLMVEDLGSVNGTFVNDQLLVGAAPLQPGDRLSVGPVTFRVEHFLGGQSKKKPAGGATAAAPNGNAAREPEDALLLPLEDGAAGQAAVEPEDALLLPLDDEAPTHLGGERVDPDV